jgi:hypothetical protein
VLVVSPESSSDTDTSIAGETGTSYSWTVPRGMGNATYAFSLSDESDVNYSVQFQIQADEVQSISGSVSDLWSNAGFLI